MNLLLSNGNVFTDLSPRNGPGISVHLAVVAQQGLYTALYSRCCVTTSKQSTKQHSLLGNILISKHTRPLLGNALTVRHVPVETGVVF
jgi:hypothetical protein